MEHDLVLEGRAVTPGGVLETELGVSDGRLSEIGRGLHGARRIRTGGCLIFPGFVDMHVHLREPGWEQKEDFRTGALAAVHGGLTTVADMPNNPVPSTTADALQAKAIAARKSSVEVRFYGGVRPDNLSALGRMAAGEVGYKAYLSETTGAGAFPGSRLAGAFAAVQATGRPVSLHCEMQEVIDRKTAELKGNTAPDAHCDIRPAEAEVKSVEEALAALEGFQELRADVCHASTGEAVSLVEGARRDGLKVYCEATLHHLYFNRRAMLDSRLLRTNPPLRSEDDRQALLGGVRSGAVSFLVTDHAPHLRDEKLDQGLAGVPGLDDYSHLVSWLIREQQVDPLRIARLASSNPSKFLRLDDRGEIAVGRRADFSIVDLHAAETVTDTPLRSKCGWSPYEGKEFPGRARWTILEGRILMDDFEMTV